MMLSISNIAWNDTQDEIMYGFLNKAGYNAIEIAPTRLVTENPYDNIKIALEKVRYLQEVYNLGISSMQSIWYGRSERIFGTDQERISLIEYTKKAIDYAATIGCTNLVFGSPKNRIINECSQMNIARDFFHEIGELANGNGVIIALEPNPEIYNTNFMNNTKETLQFVKDVDSKGLLVNMDLGTVIWNREVLEEIIQDIDLINHIHISEPYLEKIEHRDLHIQLNYLLKQHKYNHYVSIEMKNQDELDIVKNAINYVYEVMR